MPLVNGEFTELELPKKHLRVLTDTTQQWRYRALWGGRNGAKDWSMMAVIVEMGIRKGLRVLFTREIQNTIRESVYQLIVDTIDRLGYKDYYTVLNNEIRGKQVATSFIFKGLRDMNADDVKSMEGIDIAVICEAQSLTKKSFNVLNPTIRKPGSEVWLQFNPKYDDDFVYEFCVNNPPDDMIGCEVSYTDNPWTSDVIRKQAERMRLEDELLYRNIWLGEPLGQGGRVYPMYSEEYHRIKFPRDMLNQCDRYMAIDPHRKYYPAIKWYAVTPTASTVIYNEWPKKEDLDGLWYDQVRDSRTFDMTMKQLAEIILANDLTVQHGGGPITRVCDPRFARENDDFIRVLMEYGVTGWVDAPFEKIEVQRENLKTLINYNPALPMAGINMPEYYVDERCGNSNRAAKRHCWTEDKEKESEECKDFMDCDRYFLSIVDGRPVYRGPEYNQPALHTGLTNLSEHLLAKTQASRIRSALKKEKRYA